MHDASIQYMEELELNNGSESSEIRVLNDLNYNLSENAAVTNTSEHLLNATGLNNESVFEESVREELGGEMNELVEASRNFEGHIILSSVNNIIYRMRDGIRTVMLSGREQLPLIKFTLRVFIIISLTLVPLINELHSVIPLVSMFMNDNNWILVPRLMNEQIINKDLLLRLNSYESSFLTNHKENFMHSYSFNYLNLNHEEQNGGFFTKQKSRKFKYFERGSSNTCVNNEVSLLLYIGASGNSYMNGIMDINEEINTLNNRFYIFGDINRYHYNGSSLKLINNIGDNDVIRLNVPFSWCYPSVREGKAFVYNQRYVSVGSNIYSEKIEVSSINKVSVVNTRRNTNSGKPEIISLSKFHRVYGWMKLKIHKNTYKYRPTNVFKFISLFFVFFRWFILVSRMMIQVWNSGLNQTFSFGVGTGIGLGSGITTILGLENNNSDASLSSQQKLMSEIKSLISFCIFYIWSLSCVYLLFGLTTNKCSSFPRVILHESIQWLLWICVIVTLICFQLVRLSTFDTNENIEQENNSLNENNSQNNENLSTVLRSRNRKILIQHILSLISCCGFGFSLSGSVLLLSTRMTSPWVNSCFITIISQCLDLLLRGYLGLIFDGSIDSIDGAYSKIRYYKYVFPVYLLKDEEKINCNRNGQREWVVKCSYNSFPPPLIFKHNFISIRLNQVSPTFYSVSDYFKDDQYMKNNYVSEKQTEDNYNNELVYNSSHSSVNPATISSYSPPSQINCMICYENQSNVVFSPCLHSGICDACIDELMKWTVCKLRKSPCCHLCRCPIEIAWQLQVGNKTNTNISARDTGSFYSEKCIEVIYPKLQVDSDLDGKNR
ncbi:hypothetical protein FG386_000076 [Cryptosporidium ryanae]|uniref:uncharacterized protein n=1 Tax=Cryptosporidium ryanae TaxID=515981 RepID=UPI00351A6F6C|nr:hypothetical protein FG386_000076 [Cryptosporidium ryanae]